MSRNDRGQKKFSFALPRRPRSKSQKTHATTAAATDDYDDYDDSTRSIPPSIPNSRRMSRHDETISKAHQILGTSNSLHYSTSSPGYTSLVISETSADSHLDDWKTVSTAGSSSRPAMSKQPSSNVLGRIYSGERKWGSDHSSTSYRLHPQASSSTIRSHYDAKNSPLSISQQTSDSAIRDRALRRGRTPVLTDKGYDGYVASAASPVILDQGRKKKEPRKSKPARLDLSRLFPKPRDNSNQRHGNAMLSPTKMVKSPAAMSMNSEYFHHSPSRDRTPQKPPKSSHNNNTSHYNSAEYRGTSPVRKIERDEYDNAKVHVRRPPKGVQHWFDALDDSEESAEEIQKAPASRAAYSHGEVNRSASDAQTSQPAGNSVFGPRLQNSTNVYKRDSFALEDIVDIRHLTSPSQYSVNTYHSQTSSRTKESALSKTNLQDSSVLSFSSSEDEGETNPAQSRHTLNRQSVDSADYSGEIMIGRAQAYEVRSLHHRQHSAGKMSTHSTSTNAATIDIIYTPEPPPLPTYRYSRNRTYSGSKRTSHVRQPSVILEDEDSRPRTAFNEPLSPSRRSVASSRTSASAPQPHSDSSRKFMQVTPEEEALLELMRKKRAAMHRHCGSQSQSRDPSESGSVCAVDTRARERTSSNASVPHQSSTRGRAARVDVAIGTSQLRDSSVSDAWSDRHHSPASRGRSPRCLVASSETSRRHRSPPRSPTPAESGTSLTTTDHPSPLPSPMTPGRYVDDLGVNVKVANSDTSNELDDMSPLNQGAVGAPLENGKSDSSHEMSAHRRRRTASSDADMTFPVPPTHGIRDLTPVSEASSRPPSIVEPPAPKPKKKATRHISELALGTIETRPRQSSAHSTATRTSSQGSTYVNSAGKTRSRHLSPDCITSNSRTSTDSRDSVSDDVLAAWNSLGGTY
ncbi:hypothetical protein COCMIDRAFT_36454 [Bipolaris oryzae ATCC 44560]|uniref:Uncharacterized protein n=1 Tax=Bipolaris oryzae ATCC 44560 TaxID=930090 RepID=W6ZQ76_COCMI|nr:uncharacterized protein COCMIDRAFT_36454 [Bipolaris oryzae ATCC 44560]EUC45851.1 hypothetical protein COCMIDRAFT_36454 [Bipolaris oryzae ATCC 44560]